jgi:DNA-binding NtrC family response regulator
MPAESEATRALVGQSAVIASVRCQIERYGETDAPVLIEGETGTGKELVARALHDASPRSGAPFVPVNCAAIASSLFESEIFGSERGSFTGATRSRGGLLAEASGGTLFLDEIGELPLEAQAKLLRVLEDGSYRSVGGSRPLQSRARILVATNRNLQTASHEGSFRLDLYYRLDVLSIQVPPLRQRRPDIPILMDHFLAIESKGDAPPEVTPEAIQDLSAYWWPGNVRELRHVVARTLLWSSAGPIRRFDIKHEAERPARARSRHGIHSDHLMRLLARNQGRLEPVARTLGISVRTLQRRMLDLGIRARDFKGDPDRAVIDFVGLDEEP